MEKKEQPKEQQTLSPAEEKKQNAFKKVIEKGKASGHLTAQEIDNLLALLKVITIREMYLDT